MKMIKKILSVVLVLCLALFLFAGCGKTERTVNSWHYGEGSPESSLGADGDLYLDFSTWDVYVKGNGTWSTQGNINGDKGDQGDKGETGNGWLYGEGRPESTLGTDGDLYLDFLTWDVYVKGNGSWKFRENMQETPSQHDYFKEMTMTKGDILVFNRSERIDKDKAKLFFATSIQGLFAQIGESKYYYYASGKYKEWLSDIEKTYHKTTRNVTINDMLKDYIDNISSGYVLYDIENAESVNCARTIAGAEQLVMIDLGMREWAEQNGLHQRVDATTMSAEECFDTYHEKLDPSGLIQSEGFYDSSVGLTDYTIACKYFCYYPADEIQGGTLNDRFNSVREKVQSWCKGNAIIGSFPLGEQETVKYSSQHDSPSVVAADLYNVTIYNCVDFFGVNVLEQKFRPEAITEAKYPLDKHYVTIVNSDGDNLGCWYLGLFEDGFSSNRTEVSEDEVEKLEKDMKFMNEERGNFSMGWEINPSLYRLGPNIMRHVYENADASDAFVCSIMGFGHTFGRYLSDESLTVLTHDLDRYLGKLDLSVVKLLGDGGLSGEDRTIEAYSQMKNAEGFLSCTFDDGYAGDRGAVRWSANGKPFVSCRLTLWDGYDSAESAANKINNYSTDATKIDGYTYINLHVWSKDYEDVKKMVAAFDDDVVVVDPVTFIRLIKRNVPKVDAIPQNT